MKIEFRQAALAVVLAQALAFAAGCAGSATPVNQASEAAATVHRERPGSAHPGQAPADPATADAPTGDLLPSPTFHTVLPGETLTSIARSHGVTVAALVSANGIADPNRIAAGARLVVPGAAPAGSGAWILPVRDGTLLAPFGEPRGGRAHRGIDIRGRSGQEVLAAREGRVRYAGTGLDGYGQTVILDHGDGFESLYAHNSALLVREGDAVRQGHPIARVGRSGNATTEHCHFEIRRERAAIDPLAYIQGLEARR